MRKPRPKRIFVPQRGDIVWVNFSPQRGHEQAGRRPAIVLTKHAYNKRTGLVIVCPVTSRTKGYTFEVLVHTALIKGVALADQIKSLDIRSRNVTLADRLDAPTLEEIAEIARDLLT